MEKAEVTRVEPSTERYDELLELCESEFEKRVLETIHTHKLPLPTQAQKTIFNGDVPVAQADFFYQYDGLAIFIDGHDHDNDFAKESDRKKGEKLDEMGQRIFVIRYDDELDNQVASLAKYLGV